MKILHFIYDHIKNPWVGGGGAVRVYKIYKRLSEKGHKITVISGNFPKAEDYKVNENFEYRFIGSDKNYILSTFSYAFKAYKFLKENFKKYDVIIEDFAPWNPIFAYKLQDIKPVILKLQVFLGSYILKKYNILGIPFFLLEKEYPRKFKNIITVSESLNEKFGLKGKVISNGVDFIDEELKIGQYVLFLGRLDINQKGLDLIIEAFRRLENIKLVVAGDGKDKDTFLRMIQNISNIEYIGRVAGKAKLDLIKNAKFLIMPSRFEGQGIVALESASMGKPVIVSDIPELKYVVENGFGISFKNEDIEGFKEKIDYLWNNEDLILKMGKKGIEYAKKFTWDKIASEFEDYLLRVLNYYA
jgi:glycosyltransferase involved in cell wall biosynthesis